jgi:Arc/MetJ-type ribon-helix-helix transcriptional regulator
VDDVVRDAVPLLLAQEEIAREIRTLRVVGHQIAQQQRRALDVPSGLLEELEDLGVVLASAPEGHGGRPP